MRTAQDIEAYLERMPRRHSPVDEPPGTYLVHREEGGPPVVLRVDPPIILLRVHVGDVEGDPARNGALFEKLLMLNAKALVHASFGLESSKIVLCAALELENLDFNELAAVLDEIDVTLAEQVPRLAELSRAASGKGNA